MKTAQQTLHGLLCVILLAFESRDGSWPHKRSRSKTRLGGLDAVGTPTVLRRDLEEIHRLKVVFPGKPMFANVKGRPHPSFGGQIRQRVSPLMMITICILVVELLPCNWVMTPWRLRASSALSRSSIWG